MEKINHFLNWSNNQFISFHHFTCLNPYCGKQAENGHCLSCSWGYRVQNKITSVCEKCTTKPDVYDIFYFGIILLAPIFICSCIILYCRIPHQSKRKLILERRFNQIQNTNETTLTLNLNIPYKENNIPQLNENKRTMPKYSASFVLVIVCFILHAIAGFVMFVLFPPFGEFSLLICSPNALTDFYSIFSFSNSCIYEFAFPFISLPILYFISSALLSVIFYPLVILKFLRDRSRLRQYYRCLYVYPILAVSHIFYSGPLFFTYPYFVLVIAIWHSSWRLPQQLDDINKPIQHLPRPLIRPYDALLHIFRHPIRYFPGIIMHVLAIMYSMTAIYKSFNYVFIFVAIAPFTVYILTLPFTNPRVNCDNNYFASLFKNNGHVNPGVAIRLARLFEEPADNANNDDISNRQQITES